MENPKLIELKLTLNPITNAVTVEGPLNEFKLCCSIMDSARDTIFDISMQKLKGIVVAQKQPVAIKIV